MELKVKNLFNIKNVEINSNNNLCVINGHSASGKSLLLKFLYCLYSQDFRKSFKDIFKIEYDEFKKECNHSVIFKPEKRYRFQPMYIDPSILYVLGDQIIEKISTVYNNNLLYKCFRIKLEYDKKEKIWYIVMPQDVKIKYSISSHSVRYLSLLHLYIWNGMFNTLMIDNVDLFLNEELIEGICHYIKELIEKDIKLYITFTNPLMYEYLDKVIGFNKIDFIMSRYMGGKNKFEFKNVNFKGIENE